MKMKFILFLFFFGIIYLGISQDTIDTTNISKNDSISVIESDTVKVVLEKDKPIDYIELSNKIYKSNIKTVLFHRNGWDMSPPLIKYNSGEKLLLSFDDLDGDVKDYMYTIIHCDALWKPSEIKQYEYIDGYFDDYINEMSFSLNSIQGYTHYELVFPGDDVEPKLAGNYILRVFLEHQDSIVFTRKFMIVDQKVEVEGRVKQATNLAERKYMQEIDFEINTKNYPIFNAYRDLNVVIQQNGRWDNLITNLKPKMMIGDKLDFNYDRENNMDGGNEFRAVNIKNLTYTTENVARNDYNYQGYQVYLMENEKRTFKNYSTLEDINGQMKIKTETGDNSAIESEYVYTHFFLKYPYPLIDGDIYIMGALTDWKYSGESIMEYNFKRKGYEKTLYLKQGYYDYQYILLNHGKSIGDVSFIEGNHWETENLYTIYVYYCEPGTIYDKLIGVTHINSLNE